MTKEQPEEKVLPIQQIFITWDNGAKGVFSGPAVLTPLEMSELSMKRPKIVSLIITKPMIIKRKQNDKEKETKKTEDTKGLDTTDSAKKGDNSPTS